MRFDATTLAWRAAAAAIVVFMLTPLALLILFCFTESSLIAFPIKGFSLHWFRELYARPQFWDALENSLIVTSTVGAASTVIGTMAALPLARLGARAAGVSMLLLSLPVMLPPLVLGIALLSYFSSLDLKLGLPTVILAHLVFTQPFVVLIVHARMAAFDQATVEAARDLGASPLKAFFSITLPIVRPTVIGAGLVAMALSLDDFIVTFFTIGGGNTLPTFLWGMLRKGVDPTINVASVMLLLLTLATALLALRATRYRG